MAKISREQAEQLTPSSSNWFKLANDKDTALVQFPYTSRSDIGRYSVHRLEVEGSTNTQYTPTYMVDCIRELDDSIECCPLCDVGYNVLAVNILQFYNHTTGRVEVWERSKKFVERIEALMDTYGEEDFNYRVFQVQRIGAAKDKATTYDFNLMDRTDPIDWDTLEYDPVVGSTIRSYTFEDMDTYLETGDWPSSDQAASAPRSRPAARQAAAPASRRPAPVSRAASAARPAAAPPAASARRAPTAKPATTGSRTSRAQQGGGEEQF